MKYYYKLKLTKTNCIWLYFKYNLFLWCKAESSASLLQSSVSHDPSEVILICRFAAQEKILIIISVENMMLLHILGLLTKPKVLVIITPLCVCLGERCGHTGTDSPTQGGPRRSHPDLQTIAELRSRPVNRFTAGLHCVTDGQWSRTANTQWYYYSVTSITLKSYYSMINELTVHLSKQHHVLNLWFFCIYFFREHSSS